MLKFKAVLFSLMKKSLLKNAQESDVPQPMKFDKFDPEEPLQIMLIETWYEDVCQYDG